MSSTSSVVASTASAIAAATTSAADSKPGGLKIVGVILAITSGLLIGASFVFKKKGLLATHAHGEGVGYLKSWLWWTGMTMMILGELCNFAAYAFVDAVVVTPLGALSVVICAILSSIFLKESLTFFGWCGCFLAIVGSVIIALNGPQEQAVTTISAFQHLFLAPGFLVYGSVLVISSLVIIFVFAPKYGKKSMIWYISVCSLIGGLSVSCIQGLGAAIVTSAKGDNQFKQWFTYFLLVFVTVTLLTEIYYLNVALALFNTAMVTPTYYVMFTACTLISSVVLYQGLKSTITQILTVVMGFFVICAGIVILQMSKVDPEKINGLDRRSTLLLKAARQEVDSGEKTDVPGMEDAGIDALRGTLGTVGTIIRARSERRKSMRRPAGQHGADLERGQGSTELSTHGLANLPRHQLYDAPMRQSTDTQASDSTVQDNRLSTASSQPPPPPTKSPIQTQSAVLHSPRTPTIKFGQKDTAHFYPSPGKSGTAVHEQRERQWAGLPPTDRSSPFLDTSARTAPAAQQSFYNNPFSTPPNERGPLSAVPESSSQRSTLMSDLSTDSMDSLAATYDRRESPDPYDSPPETRSSVGSKRYPSRGHRDSEEEESQRLVQESPELKPGQIRLLPSIPKLRDDARP